VHEQEPTVSEVPEKMTITPTTCIEWTQLEAARRNTSKEIYRL